MHSKIRRLAIARVVIRSFSTKRGSPAYTYISRVYRTASLSSLESQSMYDIALYDFSCFDVSTYNCKMAMVKMNFESVIYCQNALI